MYLLYTFLYALVLLITLPYWLVRMVQSGKYRAGLKERLGHVAARLSLPQANETSIWFHAVSVGEVLAISELVRELKKRLPRARVYVSTTTLTGQNLARERFGEVNVFYMPLDLPFAIKPVLAAIRPELMILAETEFWPNAIRLTRASRAKIAVANARISDRSFPGYRRFRRLLRPVLECVDVFLVQSELDAGRLREIGAPGGRVRVTGNLKFDTRTAADSQLTRSLRPMLGPDQHVLVFGSTVEGEELLLVSCFKAVLKEFPDALIVLAPRHPERFDAVGELLRSSGMTFWRRSGWNSTRIAGGVLLLDTIGELASVYSLATIAFVGGSLVARGGHNILEPAQFNKPIVIGPYYENFREIVREFLKNWAVIVVPAEQLTASVLQLLRSPEECATYGQRAAALVSAGRGSTQRTLDSVVELLSARSISKAEMASPQI